MPRRKLPKSTLPSPLESQAIYAVLTIIGALFPPNEANRGPSMQTLASEAVAEPVYAVIAAAIVATMAVAWLLHSMARRRKASNPLKDLFDPSTFDQRIENAAERSARIPRRPVPRHGQRAHMARLTEVWQLDAREEAIEEIARVMRVKKGATAAPVRTVTASGEITESEWEEVKLLLPPSATDRSQAA